MFLTNDDCRIKPLFTQPGEQAWSYVGITHNSPWFHVTVTGLDKEGNECSRNYMLANTEQLLALKENPNRKISKLDIVSPSYINGSGRWRMDPLEEIWICADEEHQGQYIYKYVLENGARYSESAPYKAKEDFFDHQIFAL